MEKGYLALVLHAHLPYVHHPESGKYIEERWLFEAITETYLPLLDVFEGLVRDNIDFRITMSFTPPLLSMLGSPMLQSRYVQYLDNLIALAGKETMRLRRDHPAHKLARAYLGKFQRFKERFTRVYAGNIVSGFRRLQEAGVLEPITSAATHAFLPYLKTEQAVRAQIENAVKVHLAHFGSAPRGIWLPECGYREGIGPQLRDYGLQFFFTETHSIAHSCPKPEHGVHAPVIVPGGLAAFGRDPETAAQVWSSLTGYPGDADYREYYRDIGYELDYEYLQPNLHPSGLRLNTGIKYHRVTGDTGDKDYYDPQRAREKAAIHAGNFMFNREMQTEYLASRMGRKPIIVAAYDAELFGHWWYEGPQWIDDLCRKIHYDQQTIKMTTPAEYLCEYPENRQGQLAFSSWGRGGYGEVWLGAANEWIYRCLHRMEERMIRAADLFPLPSALERRALNQMARELMLAESSDWAFIMDHRTMVDYAVRRTKSHIRRFERLHRQLTSHRLRERWLAHMERTNPIFPEIDYLVYRTPPAGSRHTAVRRNPLKIIMLSWEYPPMVVGGLSKHVFDLSVHLAKEGVEVHVITSHVRGYPAYELNQGVHVHRVRTFQPDGLHFLEWVFQLNMAMIDYCRHLIDKYGPFHLVHAHDWLVSQAAKAMKQQFGLPLIATIHATEHGRNLGIHTDMQRTIHRLEGELTYEAWKVIACSQYMKEEIVSLFQAPADHIEVIPNGVDTKAIRRIRTDSEFRKQYALPHEKIVFFVGRMVREKGVHVLLESIPLILEQVPEAKFIAAGRGPMLDELKARTEALGVAEKVLFTGFVDDEQRNKLLSVASAAVFPSLYEPFGIVALEAMAAGTPVIVSGVGGLQEVVAHEQDGFTVLPGDALSLAVQTIRTLREEKTVQILVQSALRKVRRQYQWSRIAERTLDVYALLTSGEWGNQDESSDHGRRERHPSASAYP